MINERFAVIGLGYVGLPVAVSLGRKVAGTIGFDISPQRVKSLNEGKDWSGEVPDSELGESRAVFTSDPAALEGCTFFIVAVPTPIDEHKSPDLRALRSASEVVGQALRPGGVVVYESTVYPGVTEDVCGPILARVSGLVRGEDFFLGYSPERINPGDREHSLKNTTKVISAENEATLERVAAAYALVVDAEIFRASSIRVAEAAKVIENTQRDLNIALMNELAIIFERTGIRTRDVLEAAGTKWNFLRFSPGLVGGHCIGVDPYYLTAMAELAGYHPEVILAGRRINESMGRFVAQRLVKQLVHNDIPVRRARVAVLGVTFKEDVSDLRNTKVFDVVAELREFGLDVRVHDPLAWEPDVRSQGGVELSSWEELKDLDAVVLAVPHRHYLSMGLAALLRPLGERGIFFDLKSAFGPDEVPASVKYWSL